MQVHIYGLVMKPFKTGQIKKNGQEKTDQKKGDNKKKGDRTKKGTGYFLSKSCLSPFL